MRVIVPILLVSAGAVCAQSQYQAVRDPQSPAEITYTRYFTKDRLDRRITFYVSGGDQTQPLPIVVSVLGSGAFSNFIRGGIKRSTYFMERC
jgi:hypothetical protein